MIIIEQKDTIQELWERIAREHNVQPTRDRYNVIHRHAFAVACLENTVLPMKQIGKILNRDHATVIHSRKNHKWNLINDKTYARVYNLFTSEIEKTCERYDDQLQELLRERSIKINDSDIINNWELTYERKIKRLQERYVGEVEVLQHTNKSLVKALKRAEERAKNLNAECLRLKNLL